MRKIVITILLAVVAIAAIVWACSFKSFGLAWFPGFYLATFLGIKIKDMIVSGRGDQDHTL